MSFNAQNPPVIAGADQHKNEFMVKNLVDEEPI